MRAVERLYSGIQGIDDLPTLCQPYVVGLAIRVCRCPTKSEGPELLIPARCASLYRYLARVRATREQDVISQISFGASRSTWSTELRDYCTGLIFQCERNPSFYAEELL